MENQELAEQNHAEQVEVNKKDVSKQRKRRSTLKKDLQKSPDGQPERDELKKLVEERDYLKQVLTTLKEDPAFQAWIKDQKKEKVGENTNEMMKRVFGDFLPHLENYIGNTVGRMLQEAMEPLSQQVQVLMQKLIEKNITEARERYPDFELFEDEIMQIMQKLPGVSIDEAYKIVAFENQKTTAKEEYVAELGRKKKAQAGIPGSGSRHFSQDAPPKFKDFGEAYKYTKSQMSDI